MKKLKVLFWIVIAAIVFFTRFYQLNLYPPHLTIDEVSIGYNAYSILKTGRDEWGKLFPVSFRSVGDYKAPILIYLTVPFVGIFGLNEWGTRLPVAVFSAINVFLFWLLVSRHIFTKKYSVLSYLSSILFSLSPWLIIYSRSGFEAIIAQTFMLTNIVYALQFRKTGKLSHFFFMFFFAYLSTIAYHSTKIVVPILNIFFILTDLKFFRTCVSEWYTKKKFLFFLVCTTFIGITIFFVKNFIFGSGSARAKMTFLGQDFDYARVMLPVFIANPFSWLTAKIGLFSFWFKRYLEYFSTNFYLSSGLGLATFGQPGQGVIYAIEYPFLIIGSIVLIFFRKFFDSSISSKYITRFLLVWFFLAFLPASLTNNTQHSLRSLNVVPVVSILISLGIITVFESLKNKAMRIIYVTTVIVGLSIGIIRFIDYYTLHYPVELSETRSFGWKEMALYANEHHSEYDSVYVDHRFGTQGPYNYGIPYMYFLFYSRYDPVTFQGDPRRADFNGNFENYIFSEINWPEIDHTKHNLYIASPWSFPEGKITSDKLKYKVLFLNQTSGFFAISD